MTTKVMLKSDAVNFLLHVPTHVKAHMIDVIREKAQHADQQMVVISWTFDPCWPHIERAIKDYVYKPGIRVLFHKTHEGITVDRIAWRCDDPYQDGR